MRQTRQSGSMRGVWKQGPRYGCSDTARRKGRKRIRRTYSSLRHTPTLPLKPLRAGTSGDSGVLVVTRVRSTNTKCTRGRGCNGHPAFPTPSKGGRFINASGALRGEVANVRLMDKSRPNSQLSSPAKELVKDTDLILRSLRSKRLEGWTQRTDSRPSFETRARARSSG